MDEGGRKAVELVASIYANWIDRERIITTNLWSSELSKLTANAFLAQRISSINAISALCEETEAGVDEVARAIGTDSRIGSKFLKSSVGFGGSCFQKDILNLSYLCRHFGLPEVASYWDQVVRMNEYQKERFVSRILDNMFNTVSGKSIAILGYAFKKDTNGVRESPAISVAAGCLRKRPFYASTTPRSRNLNVHSSLGMTNSDTETANKFLSAKAEEACSDTHAIAVLTEWDEFKEMDFEKVFERMRKPAYLFDGRNLLDLAELRQIGFRAFAIGKR